MGLHESGRFDRSEFNKQLALMTKDEVFELLKAQNKSLGELGVHTPIAKMVYNGWRQSGPESQEVTPKNCLDALLRLEPNLMALESENFKKLEGVVSMVADSYERLKEINQGFSWKYQFHLSPVGVIKQN